MNRIKFSAPIIFVFLISVSSNDITKPGVMQFGKSMSEIKQVLGPLCDSISERLNEPIQLPTAQKTQSQLDCYGFEYAGKKRKVELIFADDQLDIVWILTEAEEEEFFLRGFKELYGAPTHMMEDATFFLNDGTALRNKPHEVLFISERLKQPYRQYLEQ